MLSPNAIVNLHDQLTRAWHAPHCDKEPEVIPFPNQADRKSDSDAESDFLAGVARQHRANFDLWHIEDEARTPGATDAALADVKRRIDTTNQLRNDLAEKLDRKLMDWLMPQGLPNA
ncbi:MAG: DUF4254 domain-containing protein, partial [Terracidiphilus sp.]